MSRTRERIEERPVDIMTRFIYFVTGLLCFALPHCHLAGGGSGINVVARGPIVNPDSIQLRPVVANSTAALMGDERNLRELHKVSLLFRDGAPNAGSEARRALKTIQNRTPTARERDREVLFLWRKDRLAPDSLELPRELRLVAAPIANCTDILSASSSSNDDTQYYKIDFQLREESVDAFARATRRLVGNEVAVVLRGDIILAPVLNEPLLDGELQITGEFSADEAAAIVAKIATCWED